MLTQRFHRHRSWPIVAVLLAITALLIGAVLVQGQEDEELIVSGQLIAQGLDAPVDLEEAPDGSGRLFVVDQPGVIYVVQNGAMTPFLDIRDRVIALDPGYDERGLLGLAFHPDYANNGRFFVFYSAPLRPEGPAGWDSTNYLSEFHVSADPNVADAASERRIWAIDKPQSNHNGGDISFGPDGYLYIPLGDGGGGDDVGDGHTPGLGNGQDVSNTLGSILRIDVNSGDPYGIPADNPFMSMAGIPLETWAYGFRNPWRASWDQNGRYFVSDAGQEIWEEVSIVTAGGNYGWNIREGSHCFDANDPAHNPLNCATTGASGEPLQNPIIELSHTNGPVIVGGYVYRGSAIPALSGQYVFGFWIGPQQQGTLFAANGPASGQDAMWQVMPVQVTGSNNLPGFLLAFGQDASGELYALTSQNFGPTGGTGQVWKLVPEGAAVTAEAPAATPEATDAATASPDDDDDDEATPDATAEATQPGVEPTVEPTSEVTPPPGPEPTGEVTLPPPGPEPTEAVTPATGG